ncbi:hypothetical protein MLD38_035259 [Melastoma candidum]|uniref:Uncharacterized protein n=1 Tax=Melastoma candidum TaxID=119954 RepID=A0ACB9MD13_9MYRT|nr:hypothetical protein MLD38_035259 [Melastoma candidum]
MTQKWKEQMNVVLNVEHKHHAEQQKSDPRVQRWAKGDTIEEFLAKKPRNKGKHNKPKPWDEDPSIDHWKIDRFDPFWNEIGLLEVSSFSTLFPKYKEKYLQEAWPSVKSTLGEYEVACELNLVDGSMTVSTTRKIKDLKYREVPYFIGNQSCDIVAAKINLLQPFEFVPRNEKFTGNEAVIGRQ